MAMLRGKVIAITGAGSGIGRATAKSLAKRSALLSLADANRDALEAIKNELQVGPSRAIYTEVVDVRSPMACRSWIANTVAHFGQSLAGAANLAGVVGPSISQPKGAIRELSDDEVDFVLDVNLKGTINCLRAELPHMHIGRNGRNGSAIVNAASIAGLVGVEQNGPYVAAKHGVVGVTRTVAKEEGPNVIRCNAIAP